MKWIIVHITLLLGSVVGYSQEIHLRDMPAYLRSSEQRSLYLAEHFWDCNNLGDTLLLHHPTAILDYVYILSKIPHEKASRLMTDMAKLALQYPETYSFTEYWLEQNLHDSLSPLYNDELFICFLETVINNENTDSPNERAGFLLSRCRMNSPGQEAKDFIIRNKNGQEQMLSDICANIILIWFYKTGCSACSESADYLRQSDKVKRAVTKSNMTIIPIDINQYPDLPGHLYELQYYPSFYILDSNHRVILKEASLSRLDTFLDTLLKE